jgi:hypothetical protein
MIVSNRDGRIIRIGALLLAILSIGPAVAEASASAPPRAPEYGGAPDISSSEAPTALTKAYPLRTGSPSIGPPSTGPPSAGPLRKTRATRSTTLVPSSEGNRFWLFWVALGGGLVLALFAFWLEIAGRQALRLQARRLSERPTTDSPLRVFIESTREDSAIVPAPTPPATSRTKIVGSGQSAPYTPRFGLQVPDRSSRAGQDGRASDDRQDREIEDLDGNRRSPTRHTG